MAASLRRVRPFHLIFRRFFSTSSLSAKFSTQGDYVYQDEPNVNEKETHFGFQTVKESEKEGKVHEVFHNVANKYDLMNDVMSVGIHRLWKDMFMARLAPVPGTQLIDVAGGTGDIAFRFLKYLENEYNDHSSSLEFEIPREVQAEAFMDPSETLFADEKDTASLERNKSHVTVCDINQSMLDVGKNRAKNSGFVKGTSWVCGNAESLPMADDTFDAYTIAFGIRNTTHVDRVLTEAYRVLKPGGRFMCLEFSEVPNPLLRKVYDEYSFQVIPVMGQVVAGDWHSYRYLVESIRQFPNQDDFAEMIKEAGFRFVTYENLTFGVSAIHSGFKL